MLKHNNSAPEWPKRVVILGGSGFVGNALKKKLSNEPVDLVSYGSDQLDLASDTCVAKLKNILQLEDCLIILSALTPDRGRGIDTLMKNLRMIENVSSVLSEQNIAQVIYCSSDAVYPMDFPVINESTPAAPADLYGIMHRAREIMLQSTVKAPLCIFRPTLIYGAEDSHNSYGPNRFRRQAESQQKINLGGEGEETRDHVYIEDLVSLIGLLVAYRSEGVVNIATGESLSFMDVAKQVASLFEQAIEICTSARQSAITHRQFDISCLKNAFPEFVFMDFISGSALAHNKAIHAEAGQTGH